MLGKFKSENSISLIRYFYPKKEKGGDAGSSIA